MWKAFRGSKSTDNQGDPSKSGRSNEMLGKLSTRLRLNFGKSLEEELVQGARDGKLERVQDLIHKGLDVNYQSPEQEGASALHLAAKEGQDMVVLTLLRAGAKVHLLDNEDRSALHFACGHRGTVTTVKALLDRGADAELRAQNTQRKSTPPLILAAGYNSADVVKELLARGASTTETTVDLKTALHYAAACAGGSPDSVKTLLDYDRMLINKVDQDGNTALHFAAKYGHSDIVRLLVERGADYNRCNKDIDTPLHFASKYGHLGALKALLEVGAEGGVRNKMNQSPGDIVCDQRPEDEKQLVTIAILTALQQQPQRLAQIDSQMNAMEAGSGLQDLDYYRGGGVALTDQRKAMSVRERLKNLDLKHALQNMDVKDVFISVAVAGVAGAGAALLAAGACMANPMALLQTTGVVAALVVNNHQLSVYNQERSGRIAARVRLLMPLMDMLRTCLLENPPAPVLKTTIQSLADHMVMLLQLLLVAKELLEKFHQQVRSKNMMDQLVTFLLSGGYKEDVDGLDKDLQGCVQQLNLLLTASAFIDQVTRQPASAAAIDTSAWAEENLRDVRADMKRLESVMLNVAGGVKGLETQLAEQQKVVNGQTVDLEWIVDRMKGMQAESHELELRLSRIEEGLSQVSIGLGEVRRTVVEEMDEMKKIVSDVFRYMKEQPKMKDSAPRLLIGRSSVRVTDKAFNEGVSGAYGTVVEGWMDETKVAIKIYNYRDVGDKDQKDAIREAVTLSKANHGNVVRCFGIVHDPSSNTDCIRGSLVMEWVGGGNLYMWLQKHDDDVSLTTRVNIACQIAAGMKHLHERKVVHGDLKPQNVLVSHYFKAQHVPEVKICDFGLSKYNSTTMTKRPDSSSVPSGFTYAYTSPERLQDYQRTYKDDVYAFGMLLFFLATADSPFATFKTEVLRDAVREGTRPNLDSWLVDLQGSRYQSVAAGFCQLAKDCWQHDSSDRPNFVDVYDRACSLREQAAQS